MEPNVAGGSGMGTARALAALGAAVLAACRTPDEPRELYPGYTLEARSGTAQQAPSGRRAPEPFVAVVRDSTGRPARGIRVRFRVLRGRGARLLDSLVVSDAQGVASAALVLGADPDTAVVVALLGARDARDGGARFVVAGTPPGTIVRLSPERFGSGDTIAVRGTRLAALGDEGRLVLFGGVAGRVAAAVGDSVLRVVVPPCLPAGPVQVSVRLGAATSNLLAGEMAAGGRALALAPFQGTTVVNGEAGGCLRLPGDGLRYLVVPHFAIAGDSEPTSRAFVLGVESGSSAPIGADGIASGGDASAAGPAPAPAEPRPHLRSAFERRLRAVERELARDPAALGAHAVADVDGSTVARQLAPVPTLGSERTFRVLSRLELPTYATAVARLRYVGQQVLIYEDRAAPAPIGQEALLRLGALVDRTLHPLAVEAFGVESDVDANGRVIVLLTPIVNALTPAARCGADGFVPGFFYGVDLGTRDPNSNRGEIFYSFVPDPSGTRSCPHTTEEVQRLLPPTFLHEFQHMISFNQHVLVRRGVDEEVWLNEGLSHMAEELGAQLYEQRYPAPAGRTMPSQLLPDSAVGFLRGNIDNALLYLGAPSARSATTFRGFGSLEERGASWLFVRWLVSQRGPGVLRALLQSPRTGRRNVEEAMGESFGALFGDYVLALSADSVPGVPRARVPARYRFAGHPLRALLTQALERNTRWPLTARSAPAPGTTAIGSMVQGTFDPYELTTVRGRETTLRFAPSTGSTFPTSVGAQLGVLRLSP